VTYFYDYQQIPLSVADEAFQDFYENPESLSVLDLLADLITHCDKWCEDHQAFSEQDQRETVLREMQAYLHTKYETELMELMEQDIIKNREKIEIMAGIHQRRN
jgi:hypothetical protein